MLYLSISRPFGWLRLSQRDESWKSAEIRLLRHQLTAPQRQQTAPAEHDLGRPGADRASARGHREASSLGPASDCDPEDRIGLAPRHHPPPLGSQGPATNARAARPPTATSARRSCNWPKRTAARVQTHPRRTRRPRSCNRPLDGVGDPDRARPTTRAGSSRADVGTVPPRPSTGILATDLFAVDLLDGTSAAPRRSAPPNRGHHPSRLAHNHPDDISARTVPDEFL